MLKHRDWGPSVEINSAWKQPGRIVPLRPSFYYHEKSLFPTDTMGFRIPTGFKDVKDKYAKCKKRTKIFCFGGSTTFGVYGTYEQSYPAQLEKISGSDVFNLGPQELDIHANIYTLVDALYQGLRPDIVVFLDGVNEKTGFKHAISGREDYRREHIQYSGFIDMIRAASLRRRFGNLLGRLRRNDAKEPPKVETLIRLGEEQGRFYLGSKSFVQELAQRFDFEVLFLLQPTILERWEGGGGVVCIGPTTSLCMKPS